MNPNTGRFIYLDDVLVSTWYKTRGKIVQFDYANSHEGEVYLGLFTNILPTMAEIMELKNKYEQKMLASKRIKSNFSRCIHFHNLIYGQKTAPQF